MKRGAFPHRCEESAAVAAFEVGRWFFQLSTHDNSQYGVTGADALIVG